MKTCKKCGGQFEGAKCKPCQKLYLAAYHVLNKDRAMARSAAYRAANAEKIRVDKAAYRAANAEKIKASARAWRQDNLETIRAKDSARYAAHIDRARATRAAYRAANAEKLRLKYLAYREKNRKKESARTMAWVAANPSARTALHAERRARKRNASPAWRDDFDALAIREAYHLAKLREKATGFKWHVDHVIPLMGKRVCGLHVAANLAVIPATINLKKNNRFTCGGIA